MPSPKMQHCECGKEMQPLEFFYDKPNKEGGIDKIPSCNAWFCAKCVKTVIDKHPREKGEFAGIVYEYALRGPQA
jgi:hypothetical protein